MQPAPGRRQRRLADRDQQPLGRHRDALAPGGRTTGRTLVSTAARRPAAPSPERPHADCGAPPAVVR
ncbi:hypothetical protein [Streptomyces sp. NPDC020330]|uniref:hypothetical protein n=1 Tax=unclassified Streptomyces TaxID=2593676 RepID=UPI003799462A